MSAEQNCPIYNIDLIDTNLPPDEEHLRLVRNKNIARIPPNPLVPYQVLHSDGVFEPLGGVGGAGAVAEFVQQTQGTNNSVAPGNAISYTADSANVFDTIGITTSAGPAGQGTAFTLPLGMYWVDFENSATAAWSLAIRQGPSIAALVQDDNTIAGASTATTWIHGRSIVNVVAGQEVIIVSPVVGTAGIPTAGTAAGEFTARITFDKIA